MSRKKHLLHSIHHFLIAVVLIIKGADKIAHHAIIGSVILLFGILILSYFLYTIFNKSHSQRLELMVRWFEALVALFTAYIYFSEGKTLIPYLFLVAALGFFISIYVFYKRKKEIIPVDDNRKHEHSS